MFSFIFIDGFLFWIIFAAFSVFSIVAIEKESPSFCTGIVAGFLLILEFFSPYHPLSFILHQPRDAIVIALLYIAAGAAWIVVKWVSHVYTVRDRFNEIKADIIGAYRKPSNKNPSGQYVGDRQAFFNEDGTLNELGVQRLYEEGARRVGERQLPLQATQHKSEIYMWWLCWPLSMFWTLLNDPIRRIGNFIYHLLGNTLQNISDHAFKLDNKKY
jgi:hypothetical protein